MKIVVASGNAHKIDEIAANLGRDFELISQSQLSIMSPAETGTTFVENAIIKARHAAAESCLPAIADDSGLEVDYLGGAPGIYSARYAGTDATDEANNLKLLDALASTGNRTARFQCVIVHLKHHLDPTPFIAMGTLEGSIVHAPRGENGFGYDPLFLVDTKLTQGVSKTAAELAPHEKNTISHRGQALALLRAYFEKIAPVAI